MRRVSSVAVFLLWGSTVSAFTTPIIVPRSTVVARNDVTPLMNAVESSNNNDDDDDDSCIISSRAVMMAPSSWFVWATPSSRIATAALAASLLFSPLPVDAATIAWGKVVVEPASAATTDVSTLVSPEQKAIASAKSALGEATARYNAAMKVVKEEQAADSKAQQAVATAGKNVEKARKAFITANDKLAAARSSGKAALAETQAKIAADAKAAVAKAEADLNSAKAVKISTGKKLYLAQSNAGTYDKVISQNKSIIQQEENKIALEKERAAKQAQKEKEARDKAAKDAAERAKKEKKKQEELAKKKQKVMKELQEKKAKAAANEKKRIQALEKQKKEALARAEKAKKEEAKRIAEARKKEIKNKEKYIGQLKKAESNMKSQRKSSKAIQEIESRISAEQEQLLKLKTMK